MIELITNDSSKVEDWKLMIDGEVIESIRFIDFANEISLNASITKTSPIFLRNKLKNLAILYQINLMK